MGPFARWIAGIPPLRPPLARLYWRPKRRRVCPVLPWVRRSGGTTWAPCEASVGRIRTGSPVARIGRASPSAHPVGRQPTVDPFQRAFARPVVACAAPPERGPLAGDSACALVAAARRRGVPCFPQRPASPPSPPAAAPCRTRRPPPSRPYHPPAWRRRRRGAPSPRG